MSTPSTLRPRHLNAGAISYDAVVALSQAHSDERRIELVGKIVLNEFDDYYHWSRTIPQLAERAFVISSFGNVCDAL